MTCKCADPIGQITFYQLHRLSALLGVSMTDLAEGLAAIRFTPDAPTS